MQQILDSFNMKEFADDNFKFDENGRKFSKRVENTVGKGEIARYEQFLFFQKCFQKVCIADKLKPELVWERVNPPQTQNITSVASVDCLDHDQTELDIQSDF